MGANGGNGKPKKRPLLLDDPVPLPPGVEDGEPERGPAGLAIRHEHHLTVRESAASEVGELVLDPERKLKFAERVLAGLLFAFVLLVGSYVFVPAAKEAVLVDLLKLGLFPAFMLILGYYFGKK
jgi:hypothetical protein